MWNVRFSNIGVFMVHPSIPSLHVHVHRNTRHCNMENSLIAKIIINTFFMWKNAVPSVPLLVHSIYYVCTCVTLCNTMCCVCEHPHATSVWVLWEMNEVVYDDYCDFSWKHLHYSNANRL